MDGFVAGTGSFAAEIADWARAAGVNVVGLVEMLDSARIATTIHGVPVGGLLDKPAGSRVVLGIGGNRRAIWEQLAACGWRALSVAHPTACLGSNVHLGEGATVGPVAAVGTASAIGEHAIVSRGALLGHHVHVGAFATLNPGVNIGGNSMIEDGVFIGMGAVIVNGTEVGAGAVIAAGAVVVGDVPPGVRVQGVPARKASR